MSIGTELLNAPFPLIVRNMGVGIAEAQLELDLVSLRIARMMAGFATGSDEDENAPETPYKVEFSNGKSYSLLELGFTPSFYQFVDTVIELKLSISINSERSSTYKRTQVKASAKGVGLPFFAAGSISASSVSASYASKYQYSAEGSSVMRTKLVPVPAPAILEERIRALIEAEG
ncbi:MAG: hypothetical protein V7681_07985 [Halopseudomonas sabulinigri]|tara:strand:- start:2765 stop:3289 length:525 start_codon:yes stop_codon:yes gene_type:complete